MVQVLTQTSFRGRNDNGSETAASWIAATNTNWNQVVTSPFRVRFSIADNSANTITYKSYYSLNAGAWTAITGSSTVVQAVSSASVTDGTATTQQLTVGTYIAGSIDTVDGTFAAVTHTASSGTDLEGCFKVVPGAVSVGDTVGIRIEQSSGTALNFYTATPSLTIAAATVNPSNFLPFFM